MMLGRAYPRLSAVPCLLVVSFAITAGLAPPASAGLIVPDQYASVQAAIDAALPGDTVYVRDGTYDEDIVVAKAVAVVAYPGTPSPFTARIQVPRLLGARLTGWYSDDAAFKGIVFRDRVELDQLGGGYNQYVRFESCRFDSGMVQSSGNFIFLYFAGCAFLGDVDIHPESFEVANCVFIRATLRGSGEGYARVVGNVFEGPAPVAIEMHPGDSYFLVSANTIRGTSDGIVFEGVWGGWLIENEISGCSGAAIRQSGAHGIWASDSDVRRNRIRDCGAGIVQSSVAGYIVGNHIERIRGDGIRLLGSSTPGPIDSNVVIDVQGAGIRGDSVDIVYRPVSHNRVLRAGGDGIRLAAVERGVESNIVGHCGGNGLVLKRAPRVIGNTLYSNAGSGLVVEASDDATVDTLRYNIGYGNGRYGLEWSGAGAPLMGCNDWYANALGFTAGVMPALGDVSIEPLFCDVTSDDVSLRADSPLLDAPGCAPIGALGVGCEALVGVDPGVDATPAVFGLAGVVPNPARGGLTLRLSLAGTEPARVEVVDVGGRRVLAQELEALAPGVYWVRLTQGARTALAKAAVVR